MSPISINQPRWQTFFALSLGTMMLLEAQAADHFIHNDTSYRIRVQREGVTARTWVTLSPGEVDGTSGLDGGVVKVRVETADPNASGDILRYKNVVYTTEAATVWVKEEPRTGWAKSGYSYRPNLYCTVSAGDEVGLANNAARGIGVNSRNVQFLITADTHSY